MNMKITVDVDAFVRQAEECVEEIRRRMQNGLEAASIEVEDEAVRLCPEGTHEGADAVSLAQSITTQITISGDKMSAAVGSGLDYAPYVHEGTGIRSRTGMGRTHDLPWSYMDDMGQWHSTSGMEARPFLEEAYDAKKDRVGKIIAEAVKSG